MSCLCVMIWHEYYFDIQPSTWAASAPPYSNATHSWHEHHTRWFSHWTVSFSPGLLVVGGEAWGEVPGGDRLGLHWACIGLAASVLTPPPLLAITWSTVTGTSCTTTPSRFLLWSPEGWGSVLSTGGACVGSGDGEDRDAGGGTAGNSWFMKPGKNCSILIQVVCSRFKDASFCGPYKTET